MIIASNKSNDSRMSLNSTKIKLMETQKKNILFHSPDELYTAIRNQAYVDKALIDHEQK